MSTLLYLAAIVCAFIGLAGAWPMFLVALVLAALGRLVANSNAARPSIFAQVAAVSDTRVRLVGALLLIGFALAWLSKFSVYN